jgi:cytochrome c5
VIRSAVLLVMLAGCAVQPPPVATPMDAERADVPIEDLVRGRQLLIAKCGSCHDVPVPNDQTHAEWSPRLDDMAKRAQLAGSERRLIEEYLVVMDLR